MYLTDQDAKAGQRRSSVAHLWDNGNPMVIDELNDVDESQIGCLKAIWQQ
jgi:hypothetical protein